MHITIAICFSVIVSQPILIFFGMNFKLYQRLYSTVRLFFSKVVETWKSYALQDSNQLKEKPPNLSQKTENAPKDAFTLSFKTINFQPIFNLFYVLFHLNWCLNKLVEYIFFPKSRSMSFYKVFFLNFFPLSIKNLKFKLTLTSILTARLVSNWRAL